MFPVPLPPGKYKGVVAAVVLLVGCFGALTVFGENGAVELQRLAAQQRTLEHEAFDLQRKNDDLRRRILLLESDRRHIEKIARRRLGLVRPNEIIYEFEPNG